MLGSSRKGAKAQRKDSEYQFYLCNPPRSQRLERPVLRSGERAVRNTNAVSYWTAGPRRAMFKLEHRKFQGTKQKGLSKEFIGQPLLFPLCCGSLYGRCFGLFTMDGSIMLE